MTFDDEYDWHKPHPTDRRDLRRRLGVAVVILLIAGGLISWGLLGTAGVWAGAVNTFPASEPQAVAP